MSKTRVSDLAGQFGVPPDEVVALLRQMDIQVRGPGSSIEDDQVARLRARWEREKRSRAEKQSAPAPAAKRRKSTAAATAAAAKPEPAPAPAAEAPVRRRRRAADVQAAAEEQAAAAAQAAVEAAIQEAERAPKAPILPEEPEAVTESAAPETETTSEPRVTDRGAENAPPAPPRAAGPVNSVPAHSHPATPERQRPRPITPGAPRMRPPAGGGFVPPRPIASAAPGGAPSAPRRDDRSRPAPSNAGGPGGAAGARRKKGKRGAVDQEAVDANISKTMATLRGAPARRTASDARRGTREDMETARAAEAEREKHLVRVNEFITVSELAQILKVPATEIVAFAFKNLGLMVTINQRLDFDQIELIAGEFGFRAVREEEYAAMEEQPDTDRPEDLVSRSPVVTIMGHVDHGKTSLLDYIRRTKVAAGEAGGITQHIGAYHVETPKGVVTFLDTPGHAAFTSMRARGAQSTDIVVLVVAADDGVMPQTVEAIQHARAAKVPLIVAVNKMDKPEANPDNVRQGLAQHEVIPEDWGGDTQFVPVSARTGDGVEALLEAIGLQAEVMELQAVPDGRASGVVIESSLDKGRGPVATVLVQQGLLKRGDYVVCGVEYGRVRALFDETGKQVESAGPSIPVQMLGLSGVPEAGDEFVVAADEKLARNVVSEREAKRREKRLVTRTNTLEDVMAMMGKGEGQQSLNILIKADVQGSAEALRESLTAISNDLVKVNVIASGVGGITESDATLAAASKALLIGFNVRADASARRVIESGGVDLRYFSIIYDVIDQVKQAASGLMGMEVREEIIGVAEVKDVFRSSKFGAIAGCQVVEGSVKRNKPIRVLRNDVVVFEGELESLRHYKENVEEVKSGSECGIGVKQYNDVKPGDRIECFERIEVARTL